MSYEIIYNKQFVKLEDNQKQKHYIPMILTGSNNCYEAHVRWSKAKRSRSWECVSWCLKNSESRIFGTEEQILSCVDNDIQETIDKNVGQDEWNKDIVRTAKDIKKNFGYFTSVSSRGGGCNITATQWRNIYVNGIKNALTIKQLNEIGINLSFRYFKWDSYEYSIPAPKAKTITTLQEFWDEYKIWDEWQRTCVVTDENGKTFNPSLYIGFTNGYEYVESVLKRYRKSLKKKVEYKYVDVDHFYGLYDENNDIYLYKYTRNGYRYIGYQSRSVKSFMTQQQANNYIKECIRKHRMNAENWKAKRINDKNTFKVVDK